MEEKKLAARTDDAQRLYYKDSHQKEFSAAVVSCEENVTPKGKKDGWRIVLDRTAFFPEGGGQSGDRGWLDGIPVVDTREKDGVICHVAREPLKVGTVVCGRLDFEERFSRMQQHTGEHILSGIIHSLYGYDNVGFHLGEDITTLDFNGELTDSQARDAEERANRAVFENVPVEVLYPSKEELKTLDYRSKIEIEGQVRIVKIEGYDICACCAPHVSFTGEIGLIKILSCERHRGGCRVSIVCGFRALKDYRMKQENVAAISAALSAKPEKTGEAVLHLKEQQTKTRQHLNLMQEAYLNRKLEELSPEDTCVCIFEEELDNIAVRGFINGAMEQTGSLCGAFVGTDGEGYRYILGSRTMDVRKAAQVLNARFQGKGGGSPRMVQGSLTGTKAGILEAMTQLSAGQGCAPG